ncbi:hypothetical protein B0H14DRAFT_2588646 [Mycena olivaceomarginata]|nr:hypothetical protein B0H14DRAFT_2588646 [Mycena olivaceomarginata]
MQTPLRTNFTKKRRPKRTGKIRTTVRIERTTAGHVFAIRARSKALKSTTLSGLLLPKPSSNISVFSINYSRQSLHSLAPTVKEVDRDVYVWVWCEFTSSSFSRVLPFHRQTLLPDEKRSKKTGKTPIATARIERTSPKSSTLSGLLARRLPSGHWHLRVLSFHSPIRTLTLVVFSMARLTANIEDRLIIELKLPARLAFFEA